MTIEKIWVCHSCKICNVSQNIFGSLLCMYAYLTSKPGSNQEMWFKEHSPHHRELVSTNGTVIAIWRSSQNVWRERTDEDELENMFVSGYETGEEHIMDIGDVFPLSLIYP
ncbi:hypothetical protein ACHQIQ_26505 (plasmid) [Klebsiella pneumoniae]|uniref:hypothetical protein n=1 Tax=Klebsiella pneumoniae TaxID=573 RepID=UPI003982D06D